MLRFGKRQARSCSRAADGEIGAAIKLTKYGHACVLVEDAGSRVLLDPGTYSSGFEELEGLTAVLVTHGHPDHVDVARLGALLGRNPDAAVVADEGSAATLRDAGFEATVAHAGDRLDLGMEVSVWGETHTPVHPDIPAIPNVAYVLAGLFHPGDSLTIPDPPVEILALPVGGPWLKVGDAIDYLRAVAPRVAIPIHEAVLARPESHFRFVQQLAPAGVEVRIPGHGETIEL